VQRTHQGAPLTQIVRRRNPSRVINERRHQRISDALGNSPVEDEGVSAFSSFVVGEKALS